MWIRISRGIRVSEERILLGLMWCIIFYVVYITV